MRQNSLIACIKSHKRCSHENHGERDVLAEVGVGAAEHTKDLVGLSLVSRGAAARGLLALVFGKHVLAVECGTQTKGRCVGAEWGGPHPSRQAET